MSNRHGISRAMVRVASITRLQTRSRNRNRRVALMTLSPEPSAAPAQGENGLAFDPASLPTIESIGAESNIRAFLEAGVPGDLARAALRRVWSLDPAIRDFVGLSENSVGLQRAWCDGGLRTNRRGGSRAAFDAAVRRTGHNSRCGASACHIATRGRLSEASRRIRSGRVS